MKKMTSNEIRRMFLDYFAQKKHLVIKSASLIPKDDPTLLWINAGIAPLKKYFDGSQIPENRKIVNVQKCIRTNDIDNVGKTAIHHTFFEMLGNFSIGDYFKKEAIDFTYELLTSEKYFGLDKEKLYMTVHPSDKETYDLWIDKGIDANHIIKLDSNYWEIGEGPCGPDSEVFYDRGEKYDLDNMGIDLLKNEVDNDRYVEIWNNVFSQYNAKTGVPREQYPELPNKNIDTGMGLERLVCIIQEADSNYDTDLFLPIIREIEKLSGIKYNKQRSFKIVADHIRTLTFALSDGASFSNEGRGYVLRRLLRRGVLHCQKLGITKPFMHNLVDIVITIMKEAYPSLVNNKQLIKDLIVNEEKLFYKTLKSGEQKLNDLMVNNNNVISGEEAFKLYDTYGFPFELTVEILAENGFSVSREEFNQYMTEQRERARKARNKQVKMGSQNQDLLSFTEKSTFVGYDKFECKSKIVGLFEDEKRVEKLTSDGYIILEETPFYAESGGQVADIGTVSADNFQGLVTNVIKAPHKQHIHIISLQVGEVNIGDVVNAKIDIEKRHKIMKNHSAAHLLHESLREALDENVTQAGAKVDDKVLRLDFTYPKKITDEDIIFAESLVNEKISTNVDTMVEIMPLKKAKEKGVVALFEEKYEDMVRVVNLYDSVELCGGTHVKNVGDINRCAIKFFESKGTNVYRIEAATNDNIESQLFEVIKPYNEEMMKLLNKAKKLVEEANMVGIELPFDIHIDNSAPISYKDIVFNRNEVVNVRYKVKELEKEYNKQQQKKAMENFSSFDSLIQQGKVGEFLVTKVVDYDLSTVKQLVDKLVDKMNNGFVFIANVTNNNVNFIAKCNKNISDKLNCGQIIKEASKRSNGNGGGSNVFGQGGGTDISKLDDILRSIKKHCN